jgi:CheY-like chemotaxis protein
MGWTESIHPEDRADVVLAYRAAVAARTAFQKEYRVRRADGQYRWVQTTAVPQADADPALAGRIAASTDVTEARLAGEALERMRDELTALVATRTQERRRSHEQPLAELRHRAAIEEEVARGRRLESLGALAGSIAREFSNLLTVIVGRVHLLRDRFRADEACRQDLDFIRSSAERAARLTQQLLVFGRRPRLEPQLVDRAPNRGCLAIDDDPERGTAFTLHLAAAGRSPGTIGPSPDRAGPAGRPTILLLEKDEDVRVLLRDILGPRGYHVVEARDLDEASGLADRPGPAIDLVLTDLALMGPGRDALDRIAGACPHARLLVMSSEGVDPMRRAETPGARTAIVAKPFTVTTLLTRVRELLEHPGEAHHDR